MSLHFRKPPQQVARLPLTQRDRQPIRPGDHVVVKHSTRPRKVASVHGIVDSPEGALRWEVEFTDGQRRCVSTIERHATGAEIQHFERVA